MAEVPDIAFLYPSGGMNGAGCSTKLSAQQFRRATNVRLEDEVPATRFGIRVHPLVCDNAADLAFFRANNVQGCMFFDPAAGQDGLNFQTTRPSILVANGGRKFAIDLDGSGAATVATLRDISHGIQQPEQFHLVWWGQAEYFAFAQDGQSDCFVFDASTGIPALSRGYDAVDKPSSAVPNGGTCTLYVHGRVAVVVNSRFILYGDSLHKSNLTTAENLLQFTEQVYWATGAFFVPPSELGPIQAAAILPIEDTQHGHGEAMYHCRGGIFSVETNVFPRSDWTTKAEVKTARATPGAVGPYAVAMRASDQIFRTPAGMETLRSARAQRNVEGTPLPPYSDAVDTFFEGDVPEWLRFCSVAVWNKAARLFCTVDPTLDGRFRWHSGVVVRNFAPTPTQVSAACWEGLWTLPAECAGIVQLVNGSVRGADRLFALCRGTDGVTRLVEFSEDLIDDIMEDGTRRPIRAQLLTRAMAFDDFWTNKNFMHGTLYVRDAKGEVEWGVWVRMNGTGKFIFWRGGRITVPDATGELGIEQAEPYADAIALGEFPRESATRQGVARSVEFLIRWKGRLAVEGLRIYAGSSAGESDRLDETKFAVRVGDVLAGGYSDYEYSGEQAWSFEPAEAATA